MSRKPSVHAGDDASSIGAGDYNRRNEEIEARGNLKVGSGLGMSYGGAAIGLSRAGPDGFWARVSGMSSPYSFTQVQISATGTVTDATGGISGDRAYEANSVSGLNGKVFWMEPCCGTGEVRFQDVTDGGSGTPDTPPCELTIRVSYRDPDFSHPIGDPISGATVDISGLASDPGPSTASGETGEDGEFTIDIPPGSSVTVTVSFDGATKILNLGGSSCGLVDLCYCHAAFDLTYSPPDATVSGLPSTSAGSGWTVEGGDGEYHYDFKKIDLCTAFATLPHSLNIGISKPGHIAACGIIPLACGITDGSLDLEAYDYSSCYYGPFDTMSAGINCFVPPCVAHPDKADGRLTPKNGLQVRLTSVGPPYPYNPSTGCTGFASDEGNWISLPETVHEVIGMNRHIKWDTGCRGGQGNFIANQFLPFPTFIDPSPFERRNYALNCTLQYEQSRQYYGSTRIIIDVVSGPGSCNATAQYQRWPGPSCNDPNAGKDFNNPASGYDYTIPRQSIWNNFRWSDFFNPAAGNFGLGYTPFPGTLLTAPVDFRVQDGYSWQNYPQPRNVYYLMEIREAPCE